ncbi:MAG TPA: phosphopantothenoylcysteine decarboxylase [Thermoguttaceae bacterium]|nr:phosphopantothenoylcysteine decarboxylase [Thermoguttaceae bacterium]
MSRILITSGPTRQYLDPVRYLSNASSGRMGAALARAALGAGHEAVVVSGPVDVVYPRGAEVIRVVTTEEMLAACLGVFPTCDGVIGAAAPCDYRPVEVAEGKIAKDGQPLAVRLVETPDVVASLSEKKRAGQWIVAFALESEDHRARAVEKLRRKRCDLIVVNGPEAIDSRGTSVEVLDTRGEVLAAIRGRKTEVARKLFGIVSGRLIEC